MPGPVENLRAAAQDCPGRAALLAAAAAGRAATPTARCPYPAASLEAHVWCRWKAHQAMTRAACRHDLDGKLRGRCNGR